MLQMCYTDRADAREDEISPVARVGETGAAPSGEGAYFTLFSAVSCEMTR